MLLQLFHTFDQSIFGYSCKIRGFLSRIEGDHRKYERILGVKMSIMLHCIVKPITKTRLFKYIEHSSPKTENFQIKNSDIFHISAQNIDCGYSLEPPWRGDSNVYPQSMF